MCFFVVCFILNYYNEIKETLVKNEIYKKYTVFHYVKSPYTLIIKYLINHSLSVSSATGNSSEPITAAKMATTVMVIPLEILDKNGT